jgi:hypothetical protein
MKSKKNVVEFFFLELSLVKRLRLMTYKYYLCFHNYHLFDLCIGLWLTCVKIRLFL